MSKHENVKQMYMFKTEMQLFLYMTVKVTRKKRYIG